MPQLFSALPLALLTAVPSIATPLLQERQRGESPCFTFPGTDGMLRPAKILSLEFNVQHECSTAHQPRTVTARSRLAMLARVCSPSPCFSLSVSITNLHPGRNLIADLNGMAGDLCVSGRACRFWTSGDACRVGICNNDQNGVCESATQFATWATQGFDECEPSGFTLIPDRPQWFEVYVTTPLPQQEGASVANVQSGATVERTMLVDQFKAELDDIRAMNRAQGVVKRQVPSVSRCFSSSGAGAILT